MLGVQIITGVVLVMHYTPHVDKAFASVEHIMLDVNGGWALRDAPKSLALLLAQAQLRAALERLWAMRPLLRATFAAFCAAAPLLHPMTGTAGVKPAGFSAARSTCPSFTTFGAMASALGANALPTALPAYSPTASPPMVPSVS